MIKNKFSDLDPYLICGLLRSKKMWYILKKDSVIKGIWRIEDIKHLKYWYINDKFINRIYSSFWFLFT
jgi:hypothetical protein